MKQDALKVLEDALGLPEQVRFALVDSLLESLDTTVDEDADEAWAREIEKRVSELDSKTAQGIPWTTARSRLMENLRHAK